MTIFHRSHKDRIIRGRDEHKGIKFGGSCYGTGPYDRKSGNTWREKSRHEKLQTQGHHTDYTFGSHDLVPYEQSSNSRNNQRHDDIHDQRT